MEYHQRRQAVLKALGQNSILICPSRPESLRNADTHYPYRQDSDLIYLSGFHEPDSVLILSGRDQKAILFNNVKDPQKEIWTGLRAGQIGACESFGMDEAFPIEKFDELLPGLLAGHEKVYFPFGRYALWDEEIQKGFQKTKQWIRAGKAAPYEFLNSDKLLHELRLHKSPAEIDLMKKAASISAKAHCEAMRIAKPGLFEYELAAEIAYHCQKAGAMAMAYPSIVGTGANACILHYIENQSILKKGDWVLIDAGAEYQSYAADITRCFPADGDFTGPARDLYDCVLGAQKKAIAMIKPGLIWSAIQDCLIHELTQGLKDLGILSGDLNNLIEQKAYQAYYMHNSGHWLGLDVHDVGDYRYGEQWRPLEKDMVLTVEPGLYIAPNADCDSRFQGIGIRIEDDVLVTEAGFDVLSHEVPKEIDDLKLYWQK